MPHFPGPPGALVLLLLAMTVISFVSFNAGLQSAGVAALDPCSSEFIPTEALGIMRLVFAAIIIICLVTALVTDGPTIPVSYLPASKVYELGGPKLFKINGSSRLTPFTMQSFVLLGIYFAAAGAATLVGPSVCGADSHLRIALISLLNALYPVHLLISYAVTWILLPGAFKKDPVAAQPFVQPVSLTAHNANIMMVNIELALSSQRILPELLGLSVLWGVAFCLFAWGWAQRHRLFYYFFIDYTLPLKTVLGFHLALLCVLALGSLAGSVVSSATSGYGLPVRVIAAALVTWFGMRIRPPASSRRDQ